MSILEESEVYFIRKISPENIVKIYGALSHPLEGNVAVKLHSGEAGNKNFLRPEFVKDIVNYVNGTVVECNTAYEGARDTTEKHKNLMKDHGWTKYFDVDIMDSDEPDLVLNVDHELAIPQNFVGNHMSNYDGMLVLSHFKGHAMGGYGGALKQLSIGCASSYGKRVIHGAGDPEQDMFKTDQDKFLESMADAASTVYRFFEGNIVFINVMHNLSVDCDCDGNASTPCMKDIGILASLDPVAIDQACLDLIYNSNDPGKEKMIKRIESKHGIHTVESAEKLGIGSRKYKLIEIED